MSYEKIGLAPPWRALYDAKRGTLPIMRSSTISNAFVFIATLFSARSTAWAPSSPLTVASVPSSPIPSPVIDCVPAPPPVRTTADDVDDPILQQTRTVTSSSSFGTCIGPECDIAYASTWYPPAPS